jgi:hypothetical protein
MKPSSAQSDKLNGYVRECIADAEASPWQVSMAHASNQAALAIAKASDAAAADLKGLLEAQNMRNDEIRLDLIKWSVGSALVLGALAFTAARYTH